MSGHILVIGEALVDVVHRADGRIDESPGGSPANVALALGRLGDRVRFLTQLGDDQHARRIGEWLTEAAVEVVASTVPRTATATARLDETGAADYQFDIGWSLDDIDHEAAADIGIVHTGSIAALLAPGARTVREALRRLRDTALITYDPNVRPALLPDRVHAVEEVETFVALADVVKASDEDLDWLYPGVDPLDAARTWLASGPAVVVVTMGAGGAVAVSAAGMTHAPGRRVDVIDTVGAGDTFMSALIHGLVALDLASGEARARLRAISEASLSELLRLGSAAAAITVSRPGADPPRLEEIAEFAVGAR